MATTITTGTVTTSVVDRPINTVVVYDGARGPVGPTGPTGAAGPEGPGFTSIGQWVSGQTYGPLDTVYDDSTAAQGIESMFVQRSSVPSSVSTTPPRDDPARWDEVGATDLSNVTGAIWTVVQAAHGFTGVGQPVRFDQSAGRYVLASATAVEKYATALVREVQSVDVVVLQTTGELPNANPAVITPSAGSFIPGAFYYVADATGRLTVTPPTSGSSFLQPILQATAVNAGIVLPWAPLPSAIIEGRIGLVRFYYTASGPTSSISGLDNRGNTMVFVPGDDTDVYVDGINLSELTDFSFVGTTQIDFTSPVPDGSEIEVVTAEGEAVLVAPSAAAKLDDISGSFDGVTDTFALTVGSADVDVTNAAAVNVHIEGVAQEPLVDFLVQPDGGTGTEIVFTTPPQAGWRCWAVVGQPIP